MLNGKVVGFGYNIMQQKSAQMEEKVGKTFRLQEQELKSVESWC
jgi:hypothetical protein